MDEQFLINDGGNNLAEIDSLLDWDTVPWNGGSLRKFVR